MDVNQAVQRLAFNVTGKIATGMGKPFEKYAKGLTTPTVNALANAVTGVRTGALATLSAIADACGLEPMLGGIATSLESINPLLLGPTLGWIAGRLELHPPTTSSDLGSLTPAMILCLEDKSSDTRKASGAILTWIVAFSSYDAVVAHTSNLKAASRSTVMPYLEAARKAAPDLRGGGGASASAPNPPSAASSSSGRSVAAAPAPTLVKKVSAPGLAAKASAVHRPIVRPTSRVGAPAPSSQGDDYPTGGASGMPKPRMAVKRAIAPSAGGSMASKGPAPMSSSGRAVPFNSSDPGPKVSRTTGRATGPAWTTETTFRREQVDFLHQVSDTEAI